MTTTIIRVENFDATFIDITPQGITYTTPDGGTGFIDFAIYHSNYLDILKEENRQTASEWKRVRQHNTVNQPPYLEFFTTPMTRFEFATVDDCQRLRHTVRKNHWRTMELA
jgi:hypothetical protein